MKHIMNTIGFLFFSFVLTGCIIVSVTPDTGQTVMIDPGATKEFTVSTLGTGSCAWTLDDVLLDGQTGKTFAYTPIMSDAGSHTLDLAVTVNGRTESVHWSIQVSNTSHATWKRQISDDWDIQPTADGGYVMLSSDSSGRNQLRITKLDCVGGIEWQKDCGTARGSAYHFEIQPTSDNGYIVASSQENDTAIVVKLDGDANVLWEKTFDGSDSPLVIDSIRPTTDGGYVIAGSSNLLHKGGSAYDIPTVFKLDAVGNIVWKNEKIPTINRYKSMALQTSDGGYIFAGAQYHYNDEYSGIYIAKLGSTGQIIWEREYGAIMCGIGPAIAITKEGGCIIVGEHGHLFDQCSAYVINVDAQGDLIWEHTFAKRYQTGFSSVQATDDGGYILGGWTHDVCWEITITDGLICHPNAGASYILKIDQDGNKAWEELYDLHPGNSFYDLEMVQSIMPTTDGGYIAHCYSYHTDDYLLKLDALGN